MPRARRPEVVVITGASAGVGRATARAYGARGASVGLIARGCDGLEAACREIEELGGRAVIAPADVGDAEQLEAAARVVDDAFGPPDVWINNAMARSEERRVGKEGRAGGAREEWGRGESEEQGQPGSG